MIAVINPATGETIKTYREMSPAQVKIALEQAHEAFLKWRATDYAHRAGLMKKAASPT